MVATAGLDQISWRADDEDTKVQSMIILGWFPINVIRV